MFSPAAYALECALSCALHLPFPRKPWILCENQEAFLSRGLEHVTQEEPIGKPHIPLTTGIGSEVDMGN